MEEIWKDIKGYEGYYQISNYGRVKSLERMKWYGKGYYKAPERIRKLGKNRGGYPYVILNKEGKSKSYTIHRLVAIAFIPNPDNLPEVNHKDENKENNIVSNLEWCTVLYNNTYNGRAKKVGKKVAEKLRGRKFSEETIKKISEKNTNNPKLSKSVIGINKISGLRMEFPSIMEAERQTGINKGHICECLKGKRNSAGGHIWFYADED